LTVALNMEVHKYIPSRLYGFVKGEDGREVFFHLGVFKPGAFPTDPPPPPILGEPVLVEVGTQDSPDNRPGKAPRALSVVRVQEPVQFVGIVETFDTHRGYGFIVGEDGISYHLHNSEVLDGRTPLAGDRVRFYAGTRQGRPRACHVNVRGEK